MNILLQWLSELSVIFKKPVYKDEPMSEPIFTTVPSTPKPPAFPPKIIAWMLAIGVEEGAKPELNNRGNLKYAGLTASWGAEKGFQATDGGWIAKFPTMQMGDTALCNFLVLGCQDELIAFHSPEARTLDGFTRIYAGNPPQGYINGIEKALGVPGTTLINTFL